MPPQNATDLNINNILDVTKEELDEEQKQVIERAAQQLKHKCLVSFGKIRGKVVLKQPMPRVLMPGETDTTDKEEQQFMMDLFNKMINEAITNHQAYFLKTFGNIMKEIFAGFPVNQMGPAYFNQYTASGSSTKNSSGAAIPASSNRGANGSAASSVQQPKGGPPPNFGTSKDIPSSAQKIAPSVSRITRTINHHVNQALEGEAGQAPEDDEEPPAGFANVSSYKH